MREEQKRRKKIYRKIKKIKEIDRRGRIRIEDEI
jgi:hypothetical protein